MSELRLAFIASSTTETENSIIKKTIATAITCSDSTWSLVEPSKANLLLIWVNTEKDFKTFQGLQAKYPQERLIVFACHEIHIHTRWHLPYVKTSVVPHILSIINLFARIHAHYFPESRFEKSSTFNPTEYLPGIIYQCLTDNQSRVCSYQDCPDVYLLPKEKCFYINGSIEQLAPMTIAKRITIQHIPVDDKHILETVSYVKFSSRLSDYLTNDSSSNVFENLHVKKYKRYSINELIWFSILIGSKGRLLPNNELTDTVLLKQLPEYLRIDYYAKEYKTMAECMNSQALSLSEISSVTNQSLSEVIAFYNACSLLKLIEIGNPAQLLIEKNQQARKAIEAIFTPIGEKLKGRIKLVIAGSVGSGKTTAISTLSHFAPITTETRPSDSVSSKKSTTTVAMDYGEMRFHDNLKIFLYGTPGQKRFDFMSQMLCENAWGIMLLIDNTEEDPIEELDYYLNLFDNFLGKIQLAIGITHCDMTMKPNIGDYQMYLNDRGVSCTVMAVDARDSSSLVELITQLVKYETCVTE